MYYIKIILLIVFIILILVNFALNYHIKNLKKKLRLLYENETKIKKYLFKNIDEVFSLSLNQEKIDKDILDMLEELERK